MPRLSATIGKEFLHNPLSSCGRFLSWTALLLVLAACAVPALGQGVGLRGVGAVNTSMGGAATGCPIDSAGALHWNPAAISGLPSSDMSFGMELILPNSQLSSGVPGLSGSSGSEPGVVPVPMMALVRKDESSPWTLGLGMYGIGGSKTNYPSSATNPILSPALGLGRLAATVEVMQIVPTVAYELNQNLSIGFAPTVTLANLYCSPLFLGPTNTGGEWPEGTGTRYTWGAGFQLGLYYTTENDWHFGTSFKSPQWMEPFRFRTANTDGSAKEVQFRLNYPLIVSVGASYTGFEDWVLACDVRYFNYAGTEGFGSDGFDPATGALTGLDWKDICSVALGVQRRLSEKLFVRLGYCYNDNPIASNTESVQYNVASPLIVQHTAFLGASYMFADNWIMSMTYGHAFENEAHSPLYAGGVAVPGSSLSSKAWADTFSLSFSKRF